MQANKHQIYALHLINIVLFCKPQLKYIRQQLINNLIKIKEIRRIMNRFIYVFKINCGIENTFHTAHIPT